MSLDSNRSKTVEFEDIVQELSDELDIPYKELEEICSLSLDYIKHLTEDRDTLSILIPYLGTMYYSERLGAFHKNRVSNYESGRNKEAKKKLHDFLSYRSRLIEKREEEFEVRKSYHRKRPFLYKFGNIFKKMFGKTVKGGATLGYQELWTKFSEIQNEKQNG